MIDGFLGSSSLPALERSIQYMSARHRLLAGNLANIETPGYRPVDVQPAAFQSALRDALESGKVDDGGSLSFDDSAPVSFGDGGTLTRNFVAIALRAPGERWIA